MSGPCLCGDPYCNSCFPGNDGGSLEAAEDWTIGTLQKAKLSPDEYRVVVSVGLAAVHHTRKAATAAAKETRAIQAEIEAEGRAQREYAEWHKADGMWPPQGE